MVASSAVTPLLQSQLASVQVPLLPELDLEVGMRLGELLNARWADVDKANQLISVIKTRNDKPRLIPLTRKALEILKRLRRMPRRRADL